MYFIVKNNYTKIRYIEGQAFKDYFDKKLHDTIDPLDPNRFRVNSFRRHFWDGRIKMYDKKHAQFPTGLLEDVLRLAKELQANNPELKMEIVDERQAPIRPKFLPDEIEIPEKGEILKLNGHEDNAYNYQYKAIQEIFKNQNIIINAATNAGKCITKDTWLLTDKGYRTVETIFERNHTPVESKNSQTMAIVPIAPDYDLKLINRYGCPEKVDKLTFNGYHEVYQVILENGLHENITANHPLLIKNKKGALVFKALKDLRLQDRVICFSEPQYGYESHVGSFYNKGVELAYKDIKIDEKSVLGANIGDRVDFIQGLLEQLPKTYQGKTTLILPKELLQNHVVFIQLLLLSLGVMSKRIEDNLIIDEPIFLGHLASILTSYGYDKTYYLRLLDYLKVNRVTHTPLVYSRIKSIKSLGSKPTYDVSMSVTHTFVANGIINHNTNIASGLIKEDLKLLKKEDLVFFMCNSISLAKQTQKRLAENLQQPIGFWGSGEKHIEQVNSVMVGTIYSALKDVEKDLNKQLNAKERVLKSFVKEFIPLFKVINVKQTIRTFLKTNQPKYKYQESIFEELAHLASSNYTDKEVMKVLEAYEKKYLKVLDKYNHDSINKQKEALDLLARVKVIIVDECHHASADTYQKVVLSMSNARQHIGLSGTITTKDIVKWTKLKSLFTGNLFKISNIDLIDKKISAKPRIKFIPIYQPADVDQKVNRLLGTQVQSDPILTYQTTYRLGIVENEYRNKLIVSLANKLADLNKGVTLIVVNSVEHGDIIASHLEEQGITYGYLKGVLNKEQREEILTKVKKGKLSVLIGTSVVDEGLDLNNLKYLIYASAGKSYRAVLQRIGRVLRISSSKRSTIIFDLEDRTSKLLYEHAQKRRAIYTSEKFEILE